MGPDKSSRYSDVVPASNDLSMAPDKSSSSSSDATSASDVASDGRSKEIFDQLVNCYYTVHFMCFEIVEKKDYLRLTHDHKAVQFFVDVCKSNFVGDIRFLQGKLGQADPDVLELMKQFYKGDKFIEFFYDHDEFDVESSISWVTLSEDYDVHLEDTINYAKTFTREKYYYSNYLCGLRFAELCKNTFEGLLKLAIFLRNKKKAKLSRLCGHISNMHSFLDCINKLNGNNQSEKLKSFLHFFHCFVPVGESDYALSEEVKVDAFFVALQELSCAKLKDNQKILLSAHAHCLPKNCPIVPSLEFHGVKMQAIKCVDSFLNTVTCFSFKELPQVLGVHIMHISAYHLKLMCSDFLWILSESGLFVVENGQVCRKFETNIAAIDENLSKKNELAKNGVNARNVCDKISCMDTNIGPQVNDVPPLVHKTHETGPKLECVSAKNEQEVFDYKEIKECSSCSHEDISSANSKKLSDRSALPDASMDKDTISANQELIASSCSHENIDSADSKKELLNISALAGTKTKKDVTPTYQELELESFSWNHKNMDLAEESKKLSGRRALADLLESDMISTNQKLQYSCNHENVHTPKDSETLPDKSAIADPSEKKDVTSTNQKLEYSCNHENVHTPKDSETLLDKSAIADASENEDVTSTNRKLEYSCNNENGHRPEESETLPDKSAIANTSEKEDVTSTNQNLEYSYNNENVHTPKDSETLLDKSAIADTSENEDVTLTNQKLEYSCNNGNVYTPAVSGTLPDKSAIADVSEKEDVTSTNQLSSDHLRVPLIKILRFAVKISDQSLAKAYAKTLNKEDRISKSGKIEESSVARNSSDNSASSVAASEETCADSSDASDSKSLDANGKDVEKLYFPKVTYLKPEEKPRLIESFEFLLSCYYTVHFFCFEVMTLFEGRDLRAIQFFENVLQSTDGRKSNLKCLQRKLNKAEPAVSEVIRTEYKGLKYFFMNYSEFVFNSSEHSVCLAENFESVFKERVQRLNSNAKSKINFESFCNYPWIAHCASTFGGLLDLSNMLVSSQKLSLDDLCDFVSRLETFPLVIDKLNGKNQSEKLKQLLIKFQIFVPLKDNYFKLSNKARSIDCIIFYRSLASLKHSMSKEKQTEVLRSVHDTHLSRYCIAQRLLNHDDFCKKVVERVDLVLHDVASIKFSQLPMVWGGYILHCAFHFGYKCSDLIGILLDSGLFDIGYLKVGRKAAILKGAFENVDKNLKVESSSKGDGSEATGKSSVINKNVNPLVKASGVPVKDQSVTGSKVKPSSVKMENETTNSAAISASSTSGSKSQNSADLKKVKNPLSKKSHAKTRNAYSVPEILQNTNSPLGSNFQHLVFGYLIDCVFTAQFLCFRKVEREDNLLLTSEYEAVKYFADLLKSPSFPTKDNFLCLQRELSKADAPELKEVKRVYQGTNLKAFFTKQKAFVFNSSDLSVSLSENYAGHLAGFFTKSKESLDKLCSPTWAELCGSVFLKMQSFISFLACHKVSFKDLLSHVSRLNSSLGVDGLNEICSAEEVKIFLNGLKLVLRHGDKDNSYSLREGVFTDMFIRSLDGLSKKKTIGEQNMMMMTAHWMYLFGNCFPDDFLNEENFTKQVAESVNSALQNVPFIRYFEVPRVLGAFILHSAFHLGMSCSDIIWILSSSELFVVQNGQISRKVNSEPVISNGNPSEKSDEVVVGLHLKEKKKALSDIKIPQASLKKSPLEKLTKVLAEPSRIAADAEPSLTCSDSSLPIPSVAASEQEFDIFKFALDIVKGDS